MDISGKLEKILNKELEIDTSSLLISSQEEQSIWQSFLRIVKLSQENTTSIANFSQAFESLKLQLGDSLYSLPIPSPNYVQKENDSDYFYLVCKGRVRLLGFDESKQKEVSAQLLKEGNTFGGDFLFCEVFLPYRAIAASTVEVARISIANLKQMLDKLPELLNTWQEEAQNRQRSLFFKTLTVFSPLPTHVLQQILPYLKEEKIIEGAYLAQATPKEAGRFWLRQGQIQNQPLKMGSDWGYPEETPSDWLAQTDLWLYWLSKSDWEKTVSLAPVLAKAFKRIENGSIFSTFPTQSPPKPKLEIKQSVVEFPQPKKHRHWLKIGYPFIEQQSSSDCGAACLAMISQYWGKRFSLNYLRDLAGVGRSGASLKALAKAAESLGYLVSGVRASLNPLATQKNPWIAHWQGNHYVVVYKINGDRILIADPAQGKQFISRQEFLDAWTGYALLLEPTERLHATEGEKPSLGRYLNILWHWRSLGLQIIVASLVIQVFGLVTPLFTQIILDQVVVNKSLTTLHVFAFGALLFGVWSIGLSSVRQYLLSYLGNRLDLTTISGFIRHTLSLPLKFFESRQVGDIITRVQENQKIQHFLVSQVLLAWLNFVSGIIYLGLMLYYNWQLTLLILVFIPPIVILTIAATPLLRQVSREVFKAISEEQSSLVEMISGVSTLKATAAEQILRWRWEELLTHQLNVRFKAQKLGINLEVASGLINTIGNVALLWYGATLVINNQLTIGQLVAFNMMAGYIISPIIILVNLWDELQEVVISIERLNDVLDREPEEVPSKAMLNLPNLRGEIRFEKVTFRYNLEQERDILQNISFEANAGQTIAIVGRSGSGKSTFIKLIQGLYYPTSGTIWIDGHDMRTISLAYWRSQLGVVPQDCFLFSGTIRENITLFQEEFSLEQVVEVAQLAEAHAFIQAMPLGYNTKVGERGANLSGGQRQRIAIARALLGEPRILILDEATSSLDSESELRFQQNLARLTKNRTTFIIAHRLSTVRNADCILVLDKGLLLEKGTHQELMAQRGLYYYLAQQQLDL